MGSGNSRALVENGAGVNGHVSGEHQGDIKQHAGAMFVDHQGRVKLHHRNQSLGDHIDPARVVDVALVEICSSKSRAGVNAMVEYFVHVANV